MHDPWPPSSLQVSGFSPKPSGDVLVKVEGVSKKYCRDLRKSLWYGMKDLSGELLGQSQDRDELRHEEFWAVKDVSFELKRGECLGLIGRNGAGKSTLLKMLNGLIKPDKGRIEMRGRVGALISLGAGFNPILTGRENIFVNGSILGMSRTEIADRFDEIVEFSEIDEFIEAPVQTYSSGMTVRLGFAVAAVLIQPDVLLLDEVLAVGDMGFTIKCLNKVRTLTAGSAVIFVSHNMQFVSRFCSSIIVIQKGESFLQTKEVNLGVETYLSFFPIESNISGTGEAEIQRAILIPSDNLSSSINADEPIIYQGGQAYLEIDIFNKSNALSSLTIYIMDNAMSPVACYCASSHKDLLAQVPQGLTKLKIDMGLLDLNVGRYSLVISVVENYSKICLTRVQGISPFRIRAEDVHWGSIVRHPLAFTI
jgi:lipopolysaccharide transport system ATP-binding protein